MVMPPDAAEVSRGGARAPLHSAGSNSKPAQGFSQGWLFCSQFCWHIVFQLSDSRPPDSSSHALTCLLLDFISQLVALSGFNSRKGPFQPLESPAVPSRREARQPTSGSFSLAHRGFIPDLVLGLLATTPHFCTCGLPPAKPTPPAGCLARPVHPVTPVFWGPEGSVQPLHGCSTAGDGFDMHTAKGSRELDVNPSGFPEHAWVHDRRAGRPSWL